jgi:hypothetical protein
MKWSLGRQRAIRQMTQRVKDRVAILILVIVASLVGVDLLSDAGSGADGAHVGFEEATVQSTSERTGREHARAGYKKAGVAGRAERSAGFIEDLLPPK